MVTRKEYQREYQRNRAREFRSKGLCSQCGNPDLFLNSTLCEHHYRIHRMAKLRYYAKNKQRLDAERKTRVDECKAKGVCVTCMQRPAKSKLYCGPCLIKHNNGTRIRKRYARLAQYDGIRSLLILRGELPLGRDNDTFK